MRFITSLLLASAAFAQTPATDAKAYVKYDQPVIVLNHVRVIDGTGAPGRDDQRVVIADGKIQSISTAGGQVTSGAQVLDLTGHSAMPGIVGMHDHIYYPAPGRNVAMYPEHAWSFPRLYLAGGVTSIRTTGSVEPYTDLQLKKDLFARLSRVARPEAILASNTSSLPITALASATRHPGRVIGLHFFNPVPAMKLLEIVQGERTDGMVVTACRAIGARLGKEVVVVRDAPGFATSRLGIAMALEAIRMLEEGVASAEEIDRAIELGYGHPMGPLKLTDQVGLEVRLAIAEHLHSELGERFRPPQLLRRMVRAGKLGKKSGEGFYKY